MIEWFGSLTPEHQVGLVTLIITILGGVILRGKTSDGKIPHRQPDDAPILSEITCAYMEADHDRIERLEENIRVIREAQIEMLTLVRRQDRR